MAADSMIEGKITAPEDSTVECHHGRIEHTRQQRQGIAQGLGFAGLLSGVLIGCPSAGCRGPQAILPADS
ncbi:MAG: hypothetical protein ACR2RF_00920 [Geminicoccaceae bacterium]